MSNRPQQKAIKEQLEEEIRHRARVNNLRMRMKGGFIQRGLLDTILTDRSIKLSLREDFKSDAINDSDFEELCKVVGSQFKKTYALLLLVEEAKYIREICEYRIDGKGLNDDILFDAPFLSSETYDPKQFPWRPQGASRRISEVLAQKQWLVPPQLVSHTHQRFPVQDFIFPFEEEPSNFQHGSFGSLFKVKFAKGHLEYPDGFDQVSRNALTEPLW